MQLALILLEGQHVIGTSLQHGRGKRAVAMQRIGRDGAVLEAQHLQHFHRATGLVAAGRLGGSQSHARLCRKDIDHMEWSSAAATLVGTPQRLAIDGDDPGKVDPVELRERRHEATKRALERARLQEAKHPAERVVTGNTMLQPQNSSQQQLLGAAKPGHVRGTFRPAQHGSQGDEQNLAQIVACVVRPRVVQPAENLLEFAHPTPPSIRESSSESIFHADAR